MRTIQEIVTPYQHLSAEELFEQIMREVEQHYPELVAETTKPDAIECSEELPSPFWEADS